MLCSKMKYLIRRKESGRRIELKGWHHLYRKPSETALDQLATVSADVAQRAVYWKHTHTPFYETCQQAKFFKKKTGSSISVSVLNFIFIFNSVHWCTALFGKPYFLILLFKFNISLSSQEKTISSGKILLHGKYRRQPSS